MTSQIKGTVKIANYVPRGNPPSFPNGYLEVLVGKQVIVFNSTSSIVPPVRGGDYVTAEVTAPMPGEPISSRSDYLEVLNAKVFSRKGGREIARYSR